MMNRLLPIAVALAISVNTLAILAANGVHANQRQAADPQLATDGAYRDGLFIGRLNAQQGRVSRPLVGRWSAEKDRASFVAGYRRGYTDYLASAK